MDRKLPTLSSILEWLWYVDSFPKSRIICFDMMRIFFENVYFFVVNSEDMLFIHKSKSIWLARLEIQFTSVKCETSKHQTVRHKRWLIYFGL